MIADPAGASVIGDLYALEDSATLTALDTYEECGPDDPGPHEYVRAPIIVERDSGPVAAWTYVYARDPAGLDLIAGGDFLAD